MFLVNKEFVVSTGIAEEKKFRTYAEALRYYAEQKRLGKTVVLFEQGSNFRDTEIRHAICSCLGSL